MSWTAQSAGPGSQTLEETEGTHMQDVDTSREPVTATNINPYRDLFYFISVSRAPVVVDAFRGRPTDHFLGPILTPVGLEQLPGRSIEVVV